MNYEVKLEDVTENEILVRFYTDYDINLHIRNVRIYPENAKSSEYSELQGRQFMLSKGYKIEHFNKKYKNTSSLCFIAREDISKTQIAVQIELDTSNVICKEMIYEGKLWED